MTTAKASKSQLKSKAHGVLEQLFESFHHARFLESDPLWYAHQYERAEDREVVAFICACFAFGKVTSIKKTIEFILKSLGTSPADRLKKITVQELTAISDGFVYRWIQGEDLSLYLYRIGELLRRHGSLEACFHLHDKPSPVDVLKRKKSVPPVGDTLLDVASGLIGFTEEYQSILEPRINVRKRMLFRQNGTRTSLSPSANSLFPMVAAGSACKRTFLFLRWVCRPADGIDLGLWSVDPARLIMPVDTHVFQAAKLLRLTTDKSPSLAMARRLTKRLARFDAADPTRFDFSLTRPGIMGIKDYWINSSIDVASNPRTAKSV